MKLSKLIIALGSAVISFSALASIPNHDDPTTFVGPTARIGFTNSINQTMAFNVAGEAGFRNFRVGGTWGWEITETQRLKLSADFLWQEINYAFFSGNSDQWVKQASGSGAYQFDLIGMAYAPQLDLTGYIASAPSRDLRTKSGTFVNAFGVVTPYTDYRHIAGADAWGLAPGVSINAWQGGQVGVDLNYDNVDYRQRYSAGQDASGLGGTLRLHQALSYNLGLNLAASVRRPFNLYTASLNWAHVPYYGDWTLGAFGDYMTGKNTLPSTWNIGVSANYMLDDRCPVLMPHSLKGDLKGETLVPVIDNLMAWTSEPAVYLPQVLAIADGLTTNTPSACPAGSAPALITPIPSNSSATGLINAAPFFAGNNLVFSLASITPSLSPGDTVLLSPAGVLNWDVDQAYSIVISASNACGTAESNTIVINDVPA